jgi:hypothetical protein
VSVRALREELHSEEFASKSHVVSHGRVAVSVHASSVLFRAVPEEGPDDRALPVPARARARAVEEGLAVLLALRRGPSEGHRVSAVLVLVHWRAGEELLRVHPPAVQEEVQPRVAPARALDDSQPGHGGGERVSAEQLAESVAVRGLVGGERRSREGAADEQRGPSECEGAVGEAAVHDSAAAAIPTRRAATIIFIVIVIFFDGDEQRLSVGEQHHALVRGLGVPRGAGGVRVVPAQTVAGRRVPATVALRRGNTCTALHCTAVLF